MGFQTDLHEEATRLLIGKNIHAESRSSPQPGPSWLAGEGPDDVVVAFDGFELWIYEDGANVLGPSTDKRFEVQDFDGLGELKQAVLAFLTTLLAART